MRRKCGVALKWKKLAPPLHLGFSSRRRVVPQSGDRPRPFPLDASSRDTRPRPVLPLPKKQVLEKLIPNSELQFESFESYFILRNLLQSPGQSPLYSEQWLSHFLLNNRKSRIDLKPIFINLSAPKPQNFEVPIVSTLHKLKLKRAFFPHAVGMSNSDPPGTMADSFDLLADL